MQVIAAAAPASRAGRVPVVRAAVSAILMVLVGGLLAWIFVATPMISAFTPTGRATSVQMAAGIFAWGFAIVVPAGFLILGIARLFTVVEHAAARPRTLAPRLAGELGDDHVAVTDLPLPGGRRIRELILGPFGVVVLGDVPPPSVSRIVGGRWELRGAQGRWIPIEPPLDGTARDAERIRGWLSSDDRDFLIKVHAVVVTDDLRIERTAACAVVRPDALAGWLAALPAQRGLTPDRRERLVDMLRAEAAGSRGRRTRR